MEKVFHFGAWKKSQKALTLVETVVSLTIIIIVAITTVSISVYSVNAFRVGNTKRFFEHEIKNIVELYQSYNEEQFVLAFSKYTNQTITGYNDSTYYFNSSLEYIESEEGSNFYLFLDFGNDGVNGTLDAKAFSNTGTLLASRSVTR